jgi:membrane associated rhomboid family serine protease
MIPLRDVIPTRTWPVVTVVVIALNGLVFLVQAGLSPEEELAFVYTFGLVPAAFSASGVLTSMFVHGGFGHLAGNMLFLWIFGDNIEDRLGHARYVLFYLGAGVVAALAQTAMDPASEVPMVGASGAVAGVMGGYFVLYPHSRVLTLFPFPVMLFEVPAVVLLGLWFVMQFVSGLGSLAAADALPGGVAFWAHVMGFVAGAAAVRALSRPERTAVEWWAEPPIDRDRWANRR